MTSSNNIQSSHHENLKKKCCLVVVGGFYSGSCVVTCMFHLRHVDSMLAVHVFLSESSDQLVYPHAKLACRWHPALPHTDGIYLTGTVLSFTLRHISALLHFSFTLTSPQKAKRINHNQATEQCEVKNQ